MHTDHTLDVFDTVTTTIGSRLRHFAAVTCSAFATKELRRETAARRRRALKRNANRDSDAVPAINEQSPGVLPKRFNVHTIKNHFLGDYPNQIRRFGTTDSYSTEPVRSSLFLYARVFRIQNFLLCQF